MFYTYALVSLKDRHLYIGISEDTVKRLREHNSGMIRSTKSRKPFKLIYQREFNNRIEARDYEKYLKSGYGREFLKTFMPP